MVYPRTSPAPSWEGCATNVTIFPSLRMHSACCAELRCWLTILIVINTRVIGLAEYEISGAEAGVITARYLTFGSAGAMGTGRAVGDTSNGFPGDYHVQYFDADGKMAGDLDLRIEDRITAVEDLR